MRIDVGSELVAAEKCVAAEQSVAFAFEVKSLRKPDDFVALFFHPCAKKAPPGPFLVSKITGNKLLPTVSPALAVKTMSGKRGCGWTRKTLQPSLDKSLPQALPLSLGDGNFSAACPAHPGIDLVLDSIMIWRA